MSRPPAAREAVLDAFERLLFDSGERTATLDATAREAGVSKGGLLYHFGSREALVDGLLERLSERVAIDLIDIEHAPAGPLDFFVRSSLDVDTPFDRTFVAVARLAQGGDDNAAAAMRRTRAQWVAIIERLVGDPAAALAIVLMSDGLYYDAALNQGRVDAAEAARRQHEVDALIAWVQRIAAAPTKE